MSGEAELEPPQSAELKNETDPDEEETDIASHLDDVADGAGCTEIWSHLSESREE